MPLARKLPQLIHWRGFDRSAIPGGHDGPSTAGAQDPWKKERLREAIVERVCARRKTAT